MIDSERKYRQIESGWISFSPQALLWIPCTQVYRSLLRYHRGLIRNRGNLMRTARRCGILNCISLSVEEILHRMKVCINQCNYFQKHGKHYQRKHRNKCLQSAREREDEELEKEILSIIQQEKDQSFWQRINYVMGKPCGGSVRRVLVEDGNQDGNLVENTTQESVQEAIFNNIHCKQFFIAEAAPIYTGGLRGQFGYNAATKTAKAILAGTYEYPLDFDQAMREKCEECARIWEMILIDSLNIRITKDDWRCEGKGCHESTSLLESCLLYCRTVFRPHLIF